MRAHIVLTLFTLLALAPQEPMPSAKPLEQHAWLQRLAGEWTVSSEVVMEPGAAATTWESRESVRAIGELWIVVEGSADNGGQPFTSLMTLGYDPGAGTFVGTWIDSLQTTLWSYVGHLDESGRVLTLEAEGPSFDDPSKTARYRDQIELVSPDLKRMTSSVLGEDGAWVTFLTAEGRRAD